MADFPQINNPAFYEQIPPRPVAEVVEPVATEQEEYQARMVRWYNAAQNRMAFDEAVIAFAANMRLKTRRQNGLF